MAKTVLIDDVLAKCYVCHEPSTTRWAFGHGVEAHTLAALCDKHRFMAEPSWRLIYPEASNTERRPQ